MKLTKQLSVPRVTSSLRSGAVTYPSFYILTINATATMSTEVFQLHTFLHCSHCFFLSFFLLFLKKNHQEVQALKRLIQGQFLSGLFIFTIAIWGTPAHCGLCSNSLSSCNSRRWSLLALWSSLGVDFLTFVTFFLIWNFLRWLYHDTIVLLLDDFACSKVIWLSTPSFICICHRFYLLFQSRSRSHHHLP